MSSETMHTVVHFCSQPEVVRIPGRSLWQRRCKPIKDKCCSICCAVFYILCFVCIEMVRLVISCFRSTKGTVSSAPDDRHIHPDFRDFRNIYAQANLPQEVIHPHHSQSSQSPIKKQPVG